MLSRLLIILLFISALISSCNPVSSNRGGMDLIQTEDTLMTEVGCLGLPVGTKTLYVSIDSMLTLSFDFSRKGELEELTMGTSFSRKNYRFSGNRLVGMRQTDSSFFAEEDSVEIVTDYLYEYVRASDGVTYIIECDTLHNHIRAIAECEMNEKDQIKRILRSDGTLYIFSQDMAGNTIGNFGRPVIAKAFLLIDYSPHVSTVRSIYDSEGDLKGMVSRADSTISLRFTYY